MKFSRYRKPLISILLTLALLIVGAIVMNVFSKQKQSTISQVPIGEEIRNVSVNTFPLTNTHAEITVDGRVNGYEKINLSAEVSGRLVDIGKSFKKGAFFKEGELLFKIYDQDDRYNLFAQRAALLNAISQMMPDLKFDYPSSFEKWKIYMDNFNVESEVRELPEVTDKNEKYYIAGKNIETQYYTIKSLEDRLKNYEIYAPFTGTFISINAFPGSLVSPGTPLGTIMNTSKFELEAPIASEDFQYVRPGQKVKLYSEQLDKNWSGTVSRISTQIDQSTQNIPIYISVYGRGLRDGMYLRGELKGNELKAVTEIPTSILVEQDKVFVLTDSVLVKKSIEIVNRSEKTAYVRGLEGQDQIVVEGVNNLYEGQKAQALK